MVDPPAGTYTAVIVNYDQVRRTLDDWERQCDVPEPAVPRTRDRDP